MIFIALQYFFAVFAYGVAPYIVYPYLTVGEAFTNINTFYYLFLGDWYCDLASGLYHFLVFFPQGQRIFNKT